MQLVGITGGTGFIGSHLAELLRHSGNEVVIFTRSPEKNKKHKHIRYAYWDPAKNKIDISALKDLSAVAHLAGAGIADKRWTSKRKKEIVTSRASSAEFLITQLKAYAPACKTFVSASAVGYYGPDKRKSPFTENDPPYNDFLGKTCVKWEQAVQQANDLLRTVIFRFGIVLGKDGGAFPKLARPVSLGVTPILGTGKQMVSWIHIRDLARLLHAAITDNKLNGIYNAVSPHPVSHWRLMKTIARKKGGFRLTAFVPTPFLKLVLGEMNSELLKSTTVSCQKLLDTGFEFEYPTIDKAVGEILAQINQA